MRKLTKSRKVIARDRKVMSPSITREIPLVIESAKGDKIWDADGNEYIDFASGISVSNIGHSNDFVVGAIEKQLQKVTHYAFTDYYAELPLKVAEKLCEVSPIGGGQKVFFSNSGTEAVECALKIARWHRKQPKFIGFYGAFHGRTMGSLAFTASRAVHRDGFEPLMPGVEHSYYAYCYRCPFGKKYPGCGMDCLHHLTDHIFRESCAPDEVAGLLVEPIQGEGGYIVPPPEFLKGLERICRENGIIFMVDEVQSGMCRTGKWFASQAFGIKPDVVCMAKGIASGMPMGATIAKDKYMRWPPGAHANTFGGNALACAAADATLNYMQRNKIWKRAETMGKIAMERLKEMQKKNWKIGDVRGKGLMIGVEFIHDKRKKRGAKEREKVLHAAFRDGLVLLPTGINSIRIIPPLTVSEKNLLAGLDVFERAVKSIR